MSKIHKYMPLSEASSQESQMELSVAGKYYFVLDVKANYHPLLRALRKFIEDGVGGDCWIKQIDELLDEEEFPKARATVGDIQKILGKPNKPGEAKGLEQSGVTYRDF